MEIRQHFLVVDMPKHIWGLYKIGFFQILLSDCAANDATILLPSTYFASLHADNPHVSNNVASCITSDNGFWLAY